PAARRIDFEDRLGFQKIHEETYRDCGFELVSVEPRRLVERSASSKRQFVSRGSEAARPRYSVRSLIRGVNTRHGAGGDPAKCSLRNSNQKQGIGTSRGHVKFEREFGVARGAQERRRRVQ